MMAFFLLMWLMGATTEEQKGAISEYFNNPSAVQGASAVPSPTSINGPGGASTSMIELGGGMELHHDAAPPRRSRASDRRRASRRRRAEDDARAEESSTRNDWKACSRQLRDAIDQRESLAQFKDQILLDVTPEGVRIQIIDHERRSMFPLGSARLEDFSAQHPARARRASSNDVPNRISISGHTDIRPYVEVELQQLGAISRSRQCRASRAASRRPAGGQRSAASSASPRACCSMRRAGQPAQSPHQHRRDEQAHRRWRSPRRTARCSACRTTGEAAMRGSARVASRSGSATRRA